MKEQIEFLIRKYSIQLNTYLLVKKDYSTDRVDLAIETLRRVISDLKALIKEPTKVITMTPVKVNPYFEDNTPPGYKED